ncbi:DUF2442 domain-containing protein [Paenibacillus glycinis]|uniref:DUF2442 domain-containing protein n=1 Tax=Paenibacillus glycinis TaxID=2697035 RepID=A0ABW9XSU5_9BACL|nr:DUF2442 domain-containing protein [Paenibacillus glycinis]NBD25611.1 DUF2442 domain-containing protein [Paenibacillus glycinis]
MRKISNNIIFVIAAANFKLLLKFDNGVYKIFDYYVFAKGKQGLVNDILNNLKLFESVKIDGTGTICWPNGYDIAVEFLFDNSESVDDDIFDGIYAVPPPDGKRLMIRKLLNYCDEKGVDPLNLTEEEMKKFKK